MDKHETLSGKTGFSDTCAIIGHYGRGWYAVLEGSWGYNSTRGWVTSHVRGFIFYMDGLPLVSVETAERGRGPFLIRHLSHSHRHLCGQKSHVLWFLSQSLKSTNKYTMPNLCLPVCCTCLLACILCSLLSTKLVCRVLKGSLLFFKITSLYYMVVYNQYILRIVFTKLLLTSCV